MGSLGQILSGPAAAYIGKGLGWSLLYVALGGGALVATLILAPFARSRR